MNLEMRTNLNDNNIAEIYDSDNDYITSMLRHTWKTVVPASLNI